MFVGFHSIVPSDALSRRSVRPRASGRYELAVWKAGYDIPATLVEIAADACVTVEAAALPEDDPDAIWTA